MIDSNKTQRLRSKKYTTWPRSYSIVLTTALLGAAVFITSVILQRQASADVTVVYSNGFETDTTGWAGSGTVSRVASGTNGIDAPTGSYFGVMNAAGTSGPNTQLGGYNSVWPGDWKAKIDVYLDPSWEQGEGFIYSVAVNNLAGTFRRDFTFHAGVINDESTGNVNKLMVLADTVGAPLNDTTAHLRHVASEPERRIEVAAAGWYTLQHHFLNVEGRLVVEVSLTDSEGDVAYSYLVDVKHPPFIGVDDLISEHVGGNRYGWFTNINIADGVYVDNVQRLNTTNAYTITPEATEPHTVTLSENQTMIIKGVSAGTVSLPVAVTIMDSTSNITIAISEGTEISASSPSWDGSLMAPQKVSPTNLPDHVIDVTTAVKVGSSVPLEFSQPVKVVIPGAAGKYAGYINHSNVFFDIETECGDTPAATLVGGVKECYLSEGDDLIIWTLHFSTFVAYETVGVPNTGLVHNAQTLVSLGIGIAGALVVTLSFYKIARATRS